MKIINFDNAATTLIDETIEKEYRALLNEHFYNPSSPHRGGYEVKRKIDASRDAILKNLNLSKNDYKVVFTSGATEANNLAILGVARRYKNRGKHLITTSIEHPSVLRVFYYLRDEEGFRLSILEPDQNGIVSLEKLMAAIDDETILVSIMATNNEVGSLNDVEGMTQIIRKYPKCFFHVDVAQAIAHRKLNYNLFDLFSFSAHKINGLKGSGALIMKSKISLAPMIFGGEQEFGMRSGTEDAEKDIVLSSTIRLAIDKLNSKYAMIKTMHDHLYDSLVKLEDDIIMNSPRDGSPFIVNFSLKNKRASVLVEALSNAGIYVSTSSACSAKLAKESYVIKAMFADERRAKNSIRISLGYDNTMDEIDTFLNTLEKILKEIMQND